ncbi:MAG TPA: PQQ-binding-like beta-propeller repeat protein [Pyrinomonadaceae bacterium]|nr:PQQ-binding-like beta-propeller repeat protein [Pyrinomonadaceae bacterium]
MKSRLLTAVASLCLCLSIAPVLSPAGAAASAGDWPQWRGPARDGVGRESGLLRQWPAGGPRLLWQLNDIGDGYSTPVVVGSRIYLMSNRGMENEFVAALSTKDGKVVWTTRVGNVGNPNQNPPYAKARSTPTVDGDLIYALGSDGDLACLEARTGKIRWQKNIRKEFGGVPGEWAYAESPLVDGDLVVVTPGGAEATMAAVNKKTGVTVWKSAIPDGGPAGYASAIAVEGGGRRQYVQLMPKGVVGVDAKTGKFLWRYKECAKGPAQYFTPIGRGEHVYCGALGIGGALVRLKPEGDGVAAEQVYFTRGLPNGIGGAVVVGDHIYGTEAGAKLVAAEFATGKMKWQAESLGWASIAYADGHLYIHGVNGDFALVEATPEGYRERGRFTPPAQPKKKQVGQFPEMAFSYPVIANGRLYIRDLGTLWAYDIKAGR